MDGARVPAVVVDGAVARDLEILRGVSLLGRRVREGVQEALAFHRICGVPLTTLGSGRPIACRIVGATSMTWPNWARISFFALIPFGQLTTMPLRVPPKSDGTCFIQPNGAFSATAHPAAMCG